MRVNHRDPSEAPAPVRDRTHESLKPRDTSPLRFAVLSDGLELTAWQSECISLLTMSGLCELDLFIALVPTWWRRARFAVHAILRKPLWCVFTKTLGRARMKRRTTPNPFAGRLMTIRARRELDPFAGSDGPIHGRGLDFILYLGAETCSPSVAGLARYGVWTFRFANQAQSGELPPVVGEILRGDHTITVALEQYTRSKPVPTLLRAGVFPITHHSYARSVEVALSGSVDFPLLACKELLASRTSNGAQN
jgi:hypothetical protein